MHVLVPCEFHQLKACCAAQTDTLRRDVNPWRGNHQNAEAATGKWFTAEDKFIYFSHASYLPILDLQLFRSLSWKERLLLMSSLFRKWSHLASASENMVSSSSCVLSKGGGVSPAFIESTWKGKPKIDWSPKSDDGPKYCWKPSHQVPSQSYLRLPKVCIVREPETQGASELINLLLKDETTLIFKVQRFVFVERRKHYLVPATTGITPCKFSSPDVNAKSRPHRGSTNDVGVNARPPGWRSAKKKRPPLNCLCWELR